MLKIPYDANCFHVISSGLLPNTSYKNNHVYNSDFPTNFINEGFVMNIIIVGCGKVGQKIAERLSEEKVHDIK